MYCRYHFSVRLGNTFVFEKRFSSVNQMIQCASFFVRDKDLYMSCIDSLTNRLFSHDYLISLCKEFYNDKVLL